MIFKKFLKFLVPSYIWEKYINKPPSTEHFLYGGVLSPKKDILEKYGYDGDLVNLFSDNKDFLIHKWHHYFPIYEKYLAEYRNKKNLRFLEIGVAKGGSLQLWRKFFGDEATIFGIDIDPECEKYNGIHAEVRIGSQIDKAFLKKTIDEMGGVDVILDDGSHHMNHIPHTLKYLFPKLSSGGIYMIEDLHTSFWRSYGGGYNSKGNFFNFLRILFSDMHHWYHREGTKFPEISNECSGIYIHDSITVLEKKQIFPPVYSKIV